MFKEGKERILSNKNTTPPLYVISVLDLMSEVPYKYNFDSEFQVTLICKCHTDKQASGNCPCCGKC